MAHRDLADPNRLRPKQLGEVLAKVRAQQVPIELGSRTRLTGNLDVLTSEGIWYAPRLGSQDIGMQQGYAFHLRGQNLDPSHVNDLLRSSDDFQEWPVLLHQIAGVIPTIGVERGRSIEVSKHPVLRSDKKHVVYDLGLHAFPTHRHPEAVAGFGLHTQDTQL